MYVNSLGSQMFHIFREKKTPLMKLADAFMDKAKADLAKMEAVIITLILEANDTVKSTLFFVETEETALNMALFCLQMFNQRESSLRNYQILENGSLEQKSNIIKVRRAAWVNRVRKLIVHTKEREEILIIKLLTTLLQLHLVLDTILIKIGQTSDETGIVKFECLSKTYRSMLQETIHFKETPSCFQVYNELDSNLTLMQSEYIALRAKGSWCCANRAQASVKLEIRSGNALASFEAAISKAIDIRETNLEMADVISQSFTEFEREFEMYHSPRSKKRA